MKSLEEARHEALAAKVEQFHGGARMFAAVKELKELRRDKRKDIIVHNEDGTAIFDKDKKVSAIAEDFQAQFTRSGVESIPMFTGEARPLKQPITPDEIQNVVKKLKNGKSTGPDDISAELLKAAGKEGAVLVADVINTSFSRHEPLNIGEGFLIAVQKPGKQAGPKSHLRPIVLLSLLRKILSLAVLERIRIKVDSFLSSSQAGFRRGRSTSDIVWTHRWQY